jgi:alpha-D-xyloside xylohydrolase
MRPYIAQLMKDAHEKGHPVMRPLFFDFPCDEKAWQCEDAYMFGPDLLVAPIMEFGQRSRGVYLPVGAEWVDHWAGTKYPDGTVVMVDAPLERIPIFVRGGASFAL